MRLFVVAEGFRYRVLWANSQRRLHADPSVVTQMVLRPANMHMINRMITDMRAMHAHIMPNLRYGHVNTSSAMGPICNCTTIWQRLSRPAASGLICMAICSMACLQTFVPATGRHGCIPTETHLSRPHTTFNVQVRYKTEAARPRSHTAPWFLVGMHVRGVHVSGEPHL